MKKSHFLLAVLIVPLAFVSVADLAAAPPAPAVADDPVESHVSSDELLCNARQLVAQDLPSQGPTPIPSTEVCGTCSQDICDNRNVGAQCYDTFGGWGWCIPPSGGSCSDGRARCQCATEYQ